MRRGVKRIRKLVITEIAAVDAPANQHALMYLTKRHDAEEELPMSERRPDVQSVGKAEPAGLSQGEAMDGAYAALEAAAGEYMPFATQQVMSRNPSWEPHRVLEMAKSVALELAMRQRPALYAAYSAAHHAEQHRQNQRSGHRREL